MEIQENYDNENNTILISTLYKITKIWMNDKQYDSNDLCIDKQQLNTIVEIVCNTIQINQQNQLNIVTTIQQQFNNKSIILTFAKLDKIIVNMLRHSILALDEKNAIYKQLIKLVKDTGEYLTQVADHVLQLLLITEQLTSFLLNLVIANFQHGYEFKTIALMWIPYFNFITRNLILTVQQHQKIIKQPLVFMQMQKDQNQMPYQLLSFILILCINCQYFAQKSLKCCLECLEKAVIPQKQDMQQSQEEEELTKQQIIQIMKRKRQNKKMKMVHDQLPAIYEYGYNIMVIVSLRYLQQAKQCRLISPEIIQSILNNSHYINYFTLQASSEQMFFFIEFATTEIPKAIFDMVLATNQNSLILIFLQELKKNSIQLVVQNSSKELASMFIETFRQQSYNMLLFETLKQFQCVYALSQLIQVYLEKLYKYLSTSILSIMQWQSCAKIFHTLSLKNKSLQSKQFILQKLWMILKSKVNKKNCEKLIEIGKSLLELIDKTTYKKYYSDFQDLIVKFGQEYRQEIYLFYLQTIKRQISSETIFCQLLKSLNYHQYEQRDLLFLACIAELKPEFLNLQALNKQFFMNISKKNLWFILLLSLHLNIQNKQLYVRTYFQKKLQRNQYQLKLQSRYLFTKLFQIQTQSQKSNIISKLFHIIQQITPNSSNSAHLFEHKIQIKSNKLKKQLQNYNDMQFNRIRRQFQKVYEKQIAQFQSQNNSKASLQQRKLYQINHKKYPRVRKIAPN